MEQMWPLLALGFSFCGALIVGFNHWVNLDGGRLVVLRWFGVAPLSLLAALLLPWPQQASFYLVAALMGVLLALADTLLFNAAARHGGRLTALYIPMKMLLGFALWGAIEPHGMHLLLAEPWRLPMVAGGFALSSAALFKMRRQDASRTALLAVVPVAVLLAVGDVVAKYALNSTAVTVWEVVGSATAFLTVTTTVGSVAGLVMGKAWQGFAWPGRREMLLSAAFGAILVASLSLFLVTLALAPNPGYVGAVTMLSALWLAIHGYFYHNERTNWWGGVVLVAGAILVAIGAA